MQRFFQAQADRLLVTQLPSYSPDYNPIEFLWRATKRQATHNRYFPEFETLIGSVEEALAAFAQQPERVKALFGLYLDQMARWLSRLLPQRPPRRAGFLTVYS